ncbi:MAG: nitrile hydratase subunit beta [Candidatus Eremiobacteraeota bacterium]|nr:nitrile hydratase subunit beta [Candidatus Eremiobacteraeota bacterium]MBV8353879.1 nitrile hydratase subunit beta [Candidatus Eremiobacteraeota bacterium]
MPDAPRGFHDLGGVEDEGGPIDRHEHENDFWEQRVDALMRALGTLDPPLVRTDELRRAVEGLGKEAYDSMTYYERWIAAITNILLEKNVITVGEIGRKIAEIEADERAAEPAGKR